MKFWPASFVFACASMSVAHAEEFMRCEAERTEPITQYSMNLRLEGNTVEIVRSFYNVRAAHPLNRKGDEEWECDGTITGDGDMMSCTRKYYAPAFEVLNDDMQVWNEGGAIIFEANVNYTSEITPGGPPLYKPTAETAVHTFHGRCR